MAWLAVPVWFSVLYSALSLAVHFSTWGQVAPWPGELPGTTGTLLAHEIAHASLGALAALPSRRVTPMVMASLASVLIDVDHVGQLIGLPLVARSSHSVFFFLFAGIVLWLLARLGVFGRRVSPLLVGAVAAASVLAHMAVDAALPGSGMPLMAPFSPARFEVSGGVGVALEGAAMSLVWLAWRYEMKRNR